jgi:hypothetical protein
MFWAIALFPGRSLILKLASRISAQEVEAQNIIEWRTIYHQNITASTYSSICIICTALGLAGGRGRFLALLSLFAFDACILYGTSIHFISLLLKKGYISVAIFQYWSLD